MGSIMDHNGASDPDSVGPASASADSVGSTAAGLKSVGSTPVGPASVGFATVGSSSVGISSGDLGFVGSASVGFYFRRCTLYTIEWPIDGRSTVDETYTIYTAGADSEGQTEVSFALSRR